MLGARLTALETAARAIIASHPEPARLVAVLEPQVQRMEAMLLAAPIPDAALATQQEQLRQWLRFARRYAERHAAGDGSAGGAND